MPLHSRCSSGRMLFNEETINVEQAVMCTVCMGGTAGMHAGGTQEGYLA
jgi:hypothetical protein